MKKVSLALAIAMLCSAFALGVQAGQIPGSEAGGPAADLATAMRALHGAQVNVEKLPDDKGFHKGRALYHLEEAQKELKALAAGK